MLRGKKFSILSYQHPVRTNEAWKVHRWDHYPTHKFTRSFVQNEPFIHFSKVDDAVAALDEIIAKYFEIIKNIYSLVEELQIGMAFFYRGWFQIQIGILRPYLSKDFRLLVTSIIDKSCKRCGQVSGPNVPRLMSWLVGLFLIFQPLIFLLKHNIPCK